MARRAPKEGTPASSAPIAKSQDTQPQALEPTAVLDHWKGLFESWVEKNAGQSGVDRAAPPPADPAPSNVLETGIDALGEMAEKGLEGAGGVRATSSMKAPPVMPSTARQTPQDHLKKDNLEVQAPVAKIQHEEAISSRKPMVPGKDAVFNNPWNRSVDQVDRYLKHHVHDAASLEILEWGEVTPNPKGYEVRCTYKSKNVLGKWATRTSIFVLNAEGTVMDIKDPAVSAAPPPKAHGDRPSGPVGPDRQNPRRVDHR